ncbi:MAG: DUF1501 domain-containing protein [Planctomycetaceae bacterium]|jgi:hypothetical protein|nr:DUF1501 domain-containing protein [Planctomycetaceae bacterium]
MQRHQFENGINRPMLNVPANRRQFLGRASGGLGMTALASLLEAEEPQSTGLMPGIEGGLHFSARAKRVIFLCMAGGPSHLESFDYKPKLAEMHGKPMPETYTSNQPIAQLQGQKLVCQQPMIPFRKYGDSGIEISDVFPHIGKVADELCVIKSMHTDQINHDPAHTVMNTGTSISGRPSMGSWVTYGLGSVASDLPGFVVLTSKGGRNPQPIATRQWHSGFLPGRYQGVQFHSSGSPVYYVQNPAGVSKDLQGQVIDTVNKLNGLRNREVKNPDISTRIKQYELAFQMQDSVPQLMDIADESQATLDLYGVTKADGSFAYNCLLARRMAEQGVRFIQLYHRGWDHHNDLVKYMGICSGLCDQATSALIQDLKQRDMLKDTLIIWGGEFGRTPMAQTNKGAVGRDHHMRAFSMFMAGGGVKGGTTYGNTDELGYDAVEHPVHVNDLHATMLHLLGLQHDRLTIRYQGRDFRLTDIAGEVIQDIIA